MPTYQYACTECVHEFEQVQSFSDNTLTVCPVCEGRLRKLFNAVGVVFKGSGFYRNDSRATTTGSENGSESAAPAAKDSSAKESSSKESSSPTPVKESSTKATTSSKASADS